MAARTGLSPAKIPTIVAGERPADMTLEEATAYDVAACLNRGAQLPEATCKTATALFGEHGVFELTYLVGTYCLVSVLLNAYDVPAPGAADRHGRLALTSPNAWRCPWQCQGFAPPPALRHAASFPSC